jgi:hypothetical protein
MLELILAIASILALSLITLGVFAFGTLWFDSRTNKRRKKAGLRIEKSPY